MIIEDQYEIKGVFLIPWAIGLFAGYVCFAVSMGYKTAIQAGKAE